MENKKVWFAGLSILATGVLASCGGSTSRPGDSSSSSKDDAGKSILTVATYDGGIGSEWLKESAARFEEKYASASFEAGKTGVSVKVLANKSYNGATLLSSSLTSDVYFTEDVSYYDHVAKNNFADITSLVTSPLSEFGETRSIADKIDTQYSSFLTAKDGKYYAIPFYDGIYGIIYDVDLFTKKNFYFAAAGGFVTSSTAEKSLGPDGQKGTSDDGLPATYEQFKTLCSRIRGTGLYPFSYSGGSGLPYVRRTAMNYWADYEGKDKMLLNYNLSGQADLVSSFDSGTPTIEQTAITEANGYMLQKQPGKYYALDFLKNVVLGNESNYFTNGNSHTDAQTAFIRGGVIESAQQKYAMHFDGEWWEEESTSTFDLLKQSGYAGKTERNFAIMAIPSPVSAASSAHKATIVSQNQSFCFINRSSLLPDLAKKFVGFANSDSELSKFTAATSVTRALSYDVSESDLTGASSYCRSVIDLKKTSNIIYPYSSLPRIMNHPSSFSAESVWTSIVSGASYTDPFQTFLDHSSMTSVDYFNGLSSYLTKTMWDSLA